MWLSTGWMLSQSVSGSGASTYWRWPPSRCGGTTMRRAIRVATAEPSSRRTRCRHRVDAGGRARAR